MTIYGIEIKMPHSGNLTRSQALAVLAKAIKNNYCGAGNFEKSKIKKECSNYNNLIIEDVNYSLTGILN